MTTIFESWSTLGSVLRPLLLPNYTSPWGSHLVSCFKYYHLNTDGSKIHIPHQPPSELQTHVSSCTVNILACVFTDIPHLAPAPSCDLPHVNEWQLHFPGPCPTLRWACSSLGTSLTYQEADTSCKKTAATQLGNLAHPLGGQLLPWDQLGPGPAH